MTPPELKEHPIQLVRVNIVEINFSTTQTFDGTQEYSQWELDVGHSGFLRESSEIDVFVTFSLPEGPDAPPVVPPCKFKLTIAGKFHVDIDLFPEKEIEAWAKSTAAYILYPYLREQVYAISTRARMKPVILPLFQIPPQLVKRIPIPNEVASPALADAAGVGIGNVQS